jgi:DNA primase
MSSDETIWLTSKQAADKLGVSPQAVRQKAIRGRWPRTKGNDGQARVQLPEQPYRVRTASGQAPDVSLVDSLRDHIATLKGENEALKADLSQRDAQMEAERARADKGYRRLRLAGGWARQAGNRALAAMVAAMG